MIDVALIVDRVRAAASAMSPDLAAFIRRNEALVTATIAQAAVGAELEQAMHSTRAVDLPGFAYGRLLPAQGKTTAEQRLFVKAMLEARYGKEALAPYVERYQEVMGALFDPRELQKQRARYEEAHGPMPDAEYNEQLRAYEESVRNSAYPWLAAIMRKDPPTIIAAFDKRMNPRWYTLVQGWFGDQADRVLQAAKAAEEGENAIERARRQAKQAAREKAEAAANLSKLRLYLGSREIDGYRMIEMLREPDSFLVKFNSPKIDYYAGFGGYLFELDKNVGNALRIEAPDVTARAYKAKTTGRYVQNRGAAGFITEWPERYEWWALSDFANNFERNGTGLVLRQSLSAREERKLDRDGTMIHQPVRIIEIVPQESE